MENTVEQVRFSCILQALWIIWSCRNRLIFDRVIINQQQSITMLRRAVTSAAFLHSGTINSSQRELTAYNFFKVKVGSRWSITLREIACGKPVPGWTKVNNLTLTAQQRDNQYMMLHVVEFSGCLEAFQMGVLHFPLEFKLIAALELANLKGWLPFGLKLTPCLR